MLRLRFEQLLGALLWYVYRLFRWRVFQAATEHTPVGLNVGSSARVMDGWVNLDRTINVLVARVLFLPRALYKLGKLDAEKYGQFRDGRWARVSYWDVRYPLPFDSNTFGYIYSSHVIEHLELDVCKLLLKECYRVLRPGGTLRLVVPDLFLSASQYVDSIRRLERGEVQATTTVSYLQQPVVIEQLTDRFVHEIFEPDPLRRQAFGHVWMYDCVSLSRRLREIGFEAICRRDYREGNTPNLDWLDFRPENSLHLEARKPTGKGS